MAKLEQWHDDEFVNYDEYAQFCNHSYEWTERNRQSCDRRGVPHDNRCPFCEKELKRGWTLLYIDNTPHNERGSSPRYYSTPGPGRMPIKVGRTCLKAFEAAHGRIYGR